MWRTGWCRRVSRLAAENYGYVSDNQRVYRKTNMESDSRRSGSSLSLKDNILCAPIGFSVLLAFALSFSLFQPGGRLYLFCGCLVVYAVCLMIADKKKDIFFGSMFFVVIRLAWSGAVSVLQALHSLGAR